MSTTVSAFLTIWKLRITQVLTARESIQEFQGYYTVCLCRALNSLRKNKSSLKHICVIEVCLCDKGDLDIVCSEDFGGLLGR